MTTLLLGKLGTEKMFPVMDCSWNSPDCILLSVILFSIKSYLDPNQKYSPPGEVELEDLLI